MTLIDFVFPKWRTPKTWLDKCLKSPVWDGPSTSNMINRPKHCWNLHHSTFIIFIDHCQGNWNGKNSLFLTGQIFELFADVLAAYDKYPVLNSYKLMIPIQRQYSQKQNTFSQFFAEFLKSRWTFEYFEKNHDCVYLKLRTPKTLLDKCLKTPVSEYPSTSNMETSPNTVEICSTAPLSYLLITAKTIELEKASFIDMPNLRTVC